MPDNLHRMIRLAEEFFDMKNDPSQLAINEEVMDRLVKLHPRTLNETRDADGPIAWILVVPTTEEVMRKFLDGVISEKEILERTQPGDSFGAIYLCSALVLPEHRGKGLAKRLTVEAIEQLRKAHSITSLYYWSFSEEGERLAKSVANECNLPLLRRPQH